jgi:dethiobiotin synthetase
MRASAGPGLIPPYVFVTGTDTGVGKTRTSVAILRRWAAQGRRVVGMKPIAAGADLQPDGSWANEDVLALQAASSYWPKEVNARILCNPVLLREAVSPHIAARHEGRHIDLAAITQAFHTLAAQADGVVVEGAGGFCVPLSHSQDGSHLAQALGLPVLLVVGMRLGCLNHACLTARAIVQSGLRLCGWVAYILEPAMPALAENLAYLDEQFQRWGAQRLMTLPEKMGNALQF